MLLLDRLRSILHQSPGDASPHHLAAAALLVQVARADGLLKEAEEAELRAGLEAQFALSKAEAADLAEQAEALDPDIAGLAEDAVRGLSRTDRSTLLTEAYRIAAADGRVDEVEDDLVWRIGRLLGFSEGDIAHIRGQALAG